MPGSGSCVCGNIAIQYSGEPLMAALCHCKRCQNWSGGAFSSNIGVPTTDFSITKGEPKSWARSGDVTGLENRFFFCGDCGSSLFSRPEVLEGITLIKTGCLQENEGDEMQKMPPISLELFVTRRRDYVVPIEGAQQAAEMP